MMNRLGIPTKIGTRVVSPRASTLFLSAVVTVSERTARELWVLRIIRDLLDRGHLDDLDQVELVFWVFLAAHDKHVLEALMIG